MLRLTKDSCPSKSSCLKKELTMSPVPSAILAAILLPVALTFSAWSQQAPAPPAAPPTAPAQPPGGPGAPPPAPAPAPVAPSTAPVAPAVPAAPAPPPTVPAATPPPAPAPAAPAPAAPRVSGFMFDERFTSFTEEAMPQPMLRFFYRVWPYTTISGTTVEAGGQAVKFDVVPYSLNPLNSTALLILVDTSVGSSRQPRTTTMEVTKMAIAQIVNERPPRTQVGLYTFANDLIELAPLGSTGDLIKTKLMTIKADGLGTRLYRRAMDAIDKLSAVDTQRKALLIFSDGKDEDTGYSLDNLQQAAENAGIIVMALGSPETEQDIPALGALERLVDQTKGFYAQLPVAARGVRPQLPAGFPTSVLDSLNGGGDIAVSLKDVPPGAAVTVKLTAQNGQELKKSFQLAAPAAPSPTPDPQASPSPAAVAPPLTTWEKIGVYVMAPENRVWVIAGGLALLLLAVGLLFLLFKLLKSSPPPPPPPMPTGIPTDESTYAQTTVLPLNTQGAALAYLEVQDANATRMPLNKTATRIGRRSDNDLVFSNTSISGHHAEIHISRDGAFSITDLGSGNGVFVNGERVQQCGLRDGDIIELGEVRFRFSL